MERDDVMAVGFVPQAPSAALVESTVLKEQFAHDPNQFAHFPMEPESDPESGACTIYRMKKAFCRAFKNKTIT